MTDHEKINIFGIPVSVLQSYHHAEAIVAARVIKGQKTICVAINPEKIYKAIKDRALQRIINNATLHICDGVGSALAARILHGKKIVRITGIQFFFNLVGLAEKKGFRVFLLGAKPDVNEKAAEALIKKHPKLTIAGRQDGYFASDSDVIAQINASATDMLFVAMGSPRQEKWIALNQHAINASYIMGVGGSFDVLSGTVPWSPLFFRKTGTEFIYRLIKEPQRWRRQLVLPKFAYMVFRAKFTNKETKI
ncbi:MAG: WecB/TagA/CpsF family glycosyltransferase [Chitinivibrionales bacterium]|nr:WecB/TagA/CpsF family glycosyltransferase [Chitinivibrionales bacterium]